MDELLKLLGGPPGFFALLVAAGAVFWRIKLPSIGLEYLQRELELHRHELVERDKDRAELREEVRAEKAKVINLERDYMGCLTDREKCRRHVRALERQLRSLGADPVAGEEERE